MNVDPKADTRIEQDPWVGRTVDGYRFDARIGSGGMGAVYRATQLSLGRAVAIKVLPSDSAEDKQFLERFHREADVLSKLNHPNIVTVIDRGELEGRPYLVMEYVDGTSLRAVVRNAPLPGAEALTIVRSVLSALEHAHRQGVVHRDVKPENVLVAEGGIVKVADFGLSRLVEPDPGTRLTRTHLALGTYEYMAPEQRERAREADERSDLYATGVVLYEMLTGELPIGNFAPVTRWCKLPQADRIDAIVRKSLEKDPEERYRDASEMADAVSVVLDRDAAREVKDLPSVAAAARTVEFDPLRFATRLDLLATFTSVLGVALVLGGVAWLVGTAVGPGFGYRVDGERLNSAGFVVPALGFFMLGAYTLATAHGLRRFKRGARHAQALLALVAAASVFGLPYSLWSWWALHGFKSRHYYDARARGLSAEQAISSIHETAHSSPDGPLLPRLPEPRPERRPVSWGGVALSVLGAIAMSAAWVGAFWYMRDTREVFDSEVFLVFLSVVASIWFVAFQAPVFRRGERGAVIAGLVILALGLAGGIAVADLAAEMSDLYWKMSR